MPASGLTGRQSCSDGRLCEVPGSSVACVRQSGPRRCACGMLQAETSCVGMPTRARQDLCRTRTAAWDATAACAVQTPPTHPHPESWVLSIALSTARKSLPLSSQLRSVGLSDRAQHRPQRPQSKQKQQMVKTKDMRSSSWGVKPQTSEKCVAHHPRAARSLEPDRTCPTDKPNSVRPIPAKFGTPKARPAIGRRDGSERRWTPPSTLGVASGRKATAALAPCRTL